MWASRAVGSQYYQQYIQFCTGRMQDVISIKSQPFQGMDAEQINLIKGITSKV